MIQSTVIYLDNELRDHNLFQAICRANRPDGADKDYLVAKGIENLDKGFNEPFKQAIQELCSSL